jgi:hypothetical protein
MVAPALQGTANYTLSVFGPTSNLISSTTIQVTEDTGDPNNTFPSVFGYFTISLGTLPQPAFSFSLTNEFVRSSFSNTSIQFGVSSMTLTPVPEPSSLLLLLSGATVLLWRRGVRDTLR